MSNLKSDILKLRAEGKSYSQISTELSCNKSTVCYYCGTNQRSKANQRQNVLRNSSTNILSRKLEHFKRRSKRDLKRKNINQKSISKMLSTKRYDFLTRGRELSNKDFSVEDLIKHIGDNPVCYLTGTPIDLSKHAEFTFDHKIPVSAGGDNSLENLGLCTKTVNMSKTNMTPDQYIHLCKQVLEYNGYSVEKCVE